jgi:hypothetical protein
MAEFESSDLYFQPDDPAVWNPERFSPQQRLGSFFPRWPIIATTLQSSAAKYKDSTVNCLTATRYRITATGNHAEMSSSFLPEDIMPRTTWYQESIPVLSESLDSLTRTSYSSEGQQEVKDRENRNDYDDDVESCCGSLTYSVESEWFFHHHNQNQQRHSTYPHTVSTLPRSDTDGSVYAPERLDNPNTNIVSSSKKIHTRKTNCFQPDASGDCFHPLVWVGDMFRSSSSLRSGKRRSIFLSNEHDDAIHQCADAFLFERK